MSEQAKEKQAVDQALTRRRPVTQDMSIEQMEMMARRLADSKLFGIQNPVQVFALMAVAQAEGRHPALVARDYDIIQNKPAKKAEAMLRDFFAAGGSVKWHALTDEVAEATFSHPQSGSVPIKWTIEMARKAGLASKDNWKNYPRAMLRSRCVSEGVRTVFPMATGGLHTSEEVADGEGFLEGEVLDGGAGAALANGANERMEDLKERIRQQKEGGTAPQVLAGNEKQPQREQEPPAQEPKEAAPTTEAPAGDRPPEGDTEPPAEKAPEVDERKLRSELRSKVLDMELEANLDGNKAKEVRQAMFDIRDDRGMGVEQWQSILDQWAWYADTVSAACKQDEAPDEEQSEIPLG